MKNKITYELYDDKSTIRLMGVHSGEWIESDYSIPRGDWR